MARLDIILQYDDVHINHTAKKQTASLYVESIIVAEVATGTIVPEKLISSDVNSDLRLGSDNKLVSQPNDVNFLAYYILSKG